MGIAIAIPNYNYSEYIGLTIQSVLDGCRQPDEIVVSDNASTDSSVEVVEAFHSDLVALYRNEQNIGFAPNLDRAVGRTKATHAILLSSDDLIGRDAVASYHNLLAEIGNSQRALVFSDVEKVDAAGRDLGTLSIRRDLLHRFRPEAQLSLKLECEVYSADPRDVLAWTLRTMRNPFPFVSTCFPRERWEAIGGYTGARLYNPDFWFNLRILPQLESVYYIRRSLFSYRWHERNQEGIQRQEGSLKFLVDQYLNCIQTDEAMLEFARVSRSELTEAFLRADVFERAAVLISDDRASEARRYLRLGQAAFPQGVRNHRTTFLSLLALSHFGVFGRFVLRVARKRREHSEFRHESFVG